MLSCLYKESYLSWEDYNPEVHKGKIFNKITKTEVYFRREHLRQGNYVRGCFVERKTTLIPDYIIDNDEYFIERNGKRRLKESELHLKGKQYIKDELSKSHSHLQIEFEKLIAVGERYRIIDVAAFDPNEDVFYIYEVQISPITLDSLQERTKDYFNNTDSLVVDVQWIFSSKIYNSELGNWHSEWLGKPALILDVV